MLNIIAGKHRGKRIETKKDKKIRPTGSRTREAIFNILLHGNFPGPDSPLIEGLVVDVFCGTGALGLEALSRGAHHVTFIDESSESIALARKNAAHCKEEENTIIIRSDSTSLPKARQACSLAFLDPPYNSGLAVKSLKSLANQGWLKPDAVVVVELSGKEVLAVPENFIVLDERNYGNTRIVFLVYKGITKNPDFHNAVGDGT